MFDLKTLHSVLGQLEEERGIPKAKMLEAIELALATAYKKEYGKKGQIVALCFDKNSGKTEFYQVKVVVDRDGVIMEDEEDTQDLKNMDADAIKVRYNPEHHIFIEDAKRIKKGAAIGDEIIFPLEVKGDYGRIAAQTAKQVIIQKIREAEKTSVLGEYGQKAGRRSSPALSSASSAAPYSSTWAGPWASSRTKSRSRASATSRASASVGYLYAVEESPRGILLKLSRAHPEIAHRTLQNGGPRDRERRC